MAKKKQQASFVDASFVKDPEGFFVIARRTNPDNLYDVLHWHDTNPSDITFTPYGTDGVMFFTSKEAATQYLKEALAAAEEAKSTSLWDDGDTVVVAASKIYGVHHEIEWVKSGRGRKVTKTPQVNTSLGLKRDAMPHARAVKNSVIELKYLYKGIASDFKEAQSEYTEKLVEVKQVLDDIARLEALSPSLFPKEAPARKAASKKRKGKR